MSDNIKTPEEERIIMKNRVNKKKQTLFDGGFIYNGEIFDSDVYSRINVLQIISAFDKKILSGGKKIKKADGSYIELTEEQFINILEILMRFSFELDSKEELLKNEIDLSETPLTVDTESGWVNVPFVLE